MEQNISPILTLTLVVTSEFFLQLVTGAAVISTKAVIDSASIGCYLRLPANNIFSPSVIDQRSGEELLPVYDVRSNTWYLALERDRKIKANCGRGNPLTNFEPYYYLLLTCVGGNEFQDGDEDQVILEEGLECTNERKPTSFIQRNGTCHERGTNFDVNFITAASKLTFYTVCMDESTSGTLYSSSYIDGKSIADGLGESGGNRPDFRGQEFYPFPIKQAYKWDNAFTHLADLIGSEDLVNEYFPSEQHRFSRGHLFPNGDPIKRFEKHATFYYINTVPQWQLLNGGNWAIIEQDVRDLAEKLGKTFLVTTGAYGVTTLPDANNNDVELWLARDSRGKLRLPVPRIVWKVVQDPEGKSAIAIVQVNNPWMRPQNLRTGYDILCNNGVELCHSLRWLRSTGFETPRKGYTYCCDVNELRNSIPYIPQMKYESVLGANYAEDSNYHDNGDGDDDEDEDDSDSESDEDEDDDEEEEDEEEERRAKRMFLLARSLLQTRTNDSVLRLKENVDINRIAVVKMLREMNLV